MSIRSFVLFWTSSANSVVEVISSFGLFQDFDPKHCMEFFHGILLLARNRYWHDNLYYDSKLLMANICAVFPHAIFRFFLSKKCVCSNFPIVCRCFGVAHLSVIPKICVISAIIVGVKAVPLSVMSVVGRYACLVMMSMSTFAKLIAGASVRG